jgi:ABC-type dipeptide/oligopeptide/nickel transport system permease component
MLAYIIRRLFLFVPTAIAISIIVFALIRFAPGDPVTNMLGRSYSPEAAEELRHQLGLDKPIPLQYALWLGRVMQGDLGKGLIFQQPVSELILERLPTTVVLAGISVILALGMAVPLGVLSAVRQNSLVDDLGRIAAIASVSMPVFWQGLLLIIVFAYHIPWFPPGGSLQQFGLKALVLPTIALGTGLAALLMRMVRSIMIEVLQLDYIRTARAKGLGELLVLYRHAFKNALIPLITVAGLQFGALLGGAVLTESVFGLPGLGRLLVEAVNHRDYTIIQGCVLFITFVFMVINLILDITYAFIDPRIRYT